jgi:Ca2+-binding RTX toxin-like protein
MMATVTGTEGPDNLTNDSSHATETVDALGGDDIVTLKRPNLSGGFGALTAFGGAGTDKLIFSDTLSGASFSGTGGQIRIHASLSVSYNLDYSDFERIELGGTVFGPTPTFAFGDSVDILNLSTSFTSSVSIATNGGDDQIAWASNTGNSGGSFITIDAGAGDDSVNIAGVSTGGGALNQIVHGGTGNDTIVGSAFPDDLYGEDGNDYLDGGTGGDHLTGGTGNDTYVVDSGLEQVVEQDGEGIDTVRTNQGNAASTYVLPAFVENLVLTGTAGQQAAGNGLDNVITGSTGNDTIDGGLGNDVLDLGTGGADHALGNDGNDYFFLAAAFDAADVIDGGAGTDTLALLGSYNLTLGAGSLSGIEVLSLLSGTAAGGTTHVSYSLTTVDANVPAGGTLTVYAGGLLSDETLLFDGHAETDGALSVYGGAGADIIAGGPAADAFVGGAGNDQLYGLGGNDWLEGGLGADLLRGGFGSDLFVYKSASESVGGINDEIVDFEDQVDLINLQAIDADTNTAGDQAFTFIGTDAFSHTAGELRIEGSGSTWFVKGDIDGDGTADLVIQVDTFRGYALQATNFML